MTQKQLSYSAVQDNLDRMTYSASQEPPSSYTGPEFVTVSTKAAQRFLSR
jgi:hypothetical protein